METKIFCCFSEARTKLLTFSVPRATLKEKTGGRLCLSFLTICNTYPRSARGTRKAPAGIVLTEQEDLKKALQLQAEITKLGIPAFVKACAEADGTEIPQEEYDSFDPAELNTAIAQLAAASQPQEPGGGSAAGAGQDRNARYLRNFPRQRVSGRCFC